MNRLKFPILYVAILCMAIITGQTAVKAQAPVLFKNATVIDGTGAPEKTNTDILIKDGIIAAVGSKLNAQGATVMDMKGKTIMPALISTHVHIGSLKGTANKAEYYTRDNILHQLKRYEDYGVLNILVMGSDRPLLFETGLRDSSNAGLLPGARIYSAGYGFGEVNGAPPIQFAMDHVYRPTSPDQVPAEMDSLMQVKPTVVKLWVDDFNGKYTSKMSPAIYKRIIEEAHKRGLRVAAHLYYLQDAKQLVDDGVDIIAHSVRSGIIDDDLLKEIKAKDIIYIPTLSLDEFAYIYARKAEWINDPFFKASLEPGVYEMITSKEFQDKIKNSPTHEIDIKAFETALQNVKRVYDAGILVSLGTDSGAMPLRAQGFSEHLELELMVQAGLTPMDAIKVATSNAAKALQISEKEGSIEKGKTADLLILNADPLKNIKNTRAIYEVWKAGQLVSHGPLSATK